MNQKNSNVLDLLFPKSRIFGNSDMAVSFKYESDKSSSERDSGNTNNMYSNNDKNSRLDNRYRTKLVVAPHKKWKVEY